MSSARNLTVPLSASLLLLLLVPLLLEEHAELGAEQLPEGVPALARQQAVAHDQLQALGRELLLRPVAAAAAAAAVAMSGGVSGGVSGNSWIRNFFNNYPTTILKTENSYEWIDAMVPRGLKKLNVKLI